MRFRLFFILLRSTVHGKFLGRWHVAIYVGGYVGGWVLLPKTRKAAHVWHTWPLLRISFMGGSEKGRLTGVQHLLFP